MNAFPAYEWNKAHGQMMAVGGMDLRDYFAAKAIDYFVRDVWMEKEIDDFNDAAQKCYEMADAMMRARAK